MQEDIERLKEILDNDFLYEVSYIPTNKGTFDYNQFFSLNINNRLYNDYFSFLEKYRHNFEFYDLLMQNIDVLEALKMILSDDYYQDVLDYLSKKDKDFFISHFVLYDEKDLDYCLSLGYSLKDILENASNIEDKILLTMYLKDRSLLSDILDKYNSSAYSVIAYEFINGDKSLLKKFLEKDSSLVGINNLFIAIVDNCDSFDISAILDNILLNNSTSSIFSYDNDISLIYNNELIREMIVKGGARALVFAKNPTSELVSLAKDFSYNDYIFINGSYKKSEELLLNFLNNGYFDALFNAPIEAIGEGVFDYLVKNNIDIELLKNNYTLRQSYVINKYLALHGYYDDIDDIGDIFTDINAFNFVLEMIQEGKCPDSNNLSIKLLSYLVNKNFEQIANIQSNFDFSPEVCDALIRLGLTSEIYIKYFKYSNSSLSLYFAEHGEYEVMFKGPLFNWEFSQYLDKLTYDMYLKYVDKYGVGEISFEIFAKFFREGHYEIFLNAKFVDYSYNPSHILDALGLTDLTYEDYLKLPDYVRDFPLLKNKFLAYSSDMYLEVLKSEPTSEALEKAALNNMPFEEFISYINEESSLLTFPTVMHYLENNHLDIIKYVSKGCDFPQIGLIVDKILSLVNGNVPPDYVMERRYIADGIVERFIKKKDFSILKFCTFFNSRILKLLIDNGYTLDDFIKNPFYNWQLICHFLTKDNEEKIMDCFEQLANDSNIKYVRDSHNIIVKAYHEGYSISNINKLIKLFDVSPLDVLKNIDENDYVMFNILDFNNLFSEKILVDKILPYLSLDKIKSNLAIGTSNDMRCYIIEKMVDLGHSEFIEYFTGRISINAVKKALLAGYFPSEEVLVNNSNLKKVIENLNFTEEELDYLKSRIDKQPLFVIYFKDILHNSDLIYSYILKEPRILLYCDDEIACNQDLLRKVVVTNPVIVGQLINKLNYSFILELVEINKSLLKYIPSSIFSDEELVSFVQSYPEFIDYVAIGNDEIFIKAFKSGYKFSNNSSFLTLTYALKFKILIPKDILLNLDYKSLFSLLFSNAEFYNNNRDYVKDVLDTLKSKDEDEFLWQLYCYVVPQLMYNAILKELNDVYHLRVDELKGIVIDSKERYLLNLLLLDIASLDDEHYKIMIDELLEKSSFKTDIIASVYKNGKIDLASFYAKKYFMENPLFLIKFVDNLDDEFVKVLKNIILDYNSLFRLLISNPNLYNNNNKGYIKDILDTLKSKDEDEDEFLWQLFSYISSNNLYDSILKELSDDYHARVDELRGIGIDSKERYLFNLLLLDIASLDDEKYKIKIDELLEKSPFKTDIIASVYKNGKIDLASFYAKKYFMENPLFLIKFVDNLDDEFIKVLKGVILDCPELLSFPIVKNSIDKIVEDKETVLKLFALGKYDIFSNLSEELRNDYDILVQYIKKNPDFILTMNKNDYYRELCLEALAIRPGLYLSITDKEILSDEELLRKVLPFCASAFLKADSSLQTIENFKLITDFKTLDLDKTDVSLFTKIINFNLFDANDEILRGIIADYLFIHQKELDPMIFKNNYIIQVFIKEFPNRRIFKKLISLFNYFDTNDLPSDICEVCKNAQEIINGSNKVNLLEDNSLFSYDLVKYIYPLMGLNVTLDLLKYNTKAAEEICKMIKENRSEEVLNYWQFVKNFKLFEDNERLIHLAFMNYSSFSILINDVLKHKNELTNKDIDNLRKIIFNSNYYKITSFDELKKYKLTIDKRVEDILNRNDITELKNGLATLFGFLNIDEMKMTFNNFQFGNFAKLKYVYDDIKKKYGYEYLDTIKLKKEDIELIILMKKIIETNNISVIKELFVNLISKNQKVLDYSDDVDELINKFRKIYNAQFNSCLTDISSLQSKRVSYDDPKNTYGVTIITMNGEPFKFLAHRLYNYDSSMITSQKSFSEMLMEDPALWTKLDGSSTLSTSSFSDKGFWFLHSDTSSGVVYLFNNLPPDFLLFMYGRDLFVEHGGHKLRPKAQRNLFMDIDSLNQDSCYHHGDYNEVAGFRMGMLPCAFACVGPKPNPETIRAAKYFRDTFGVDIPIIIFDQPAYEQKKQDDYTKAVEQYKIDSSYEALLGIFYDGKVNHNKKSKILADKIDLCLSSLKEQYYKGEITLYDLLRKVQELENVANRIFSGDEDCRKEMRKLQIFKKSLCVLNNVSNEEIIRLEAANLGESGIMYKFIEEGKTYLVKPAVDKEHYQSQSFRTDIQVAASKLQKIISPETSVDVQKVENRLLTLSKQEYLEIDHEETKKLNDWARNGGPIEQKYLDQLLREYVLDFVICNFDAFSGNFVVDTNGNIRGIDKEQAFRFLDDEASLNPDFSYVPNGNSRIPIYKILFERYKNKEIDLNLDIIYDTLDALKAIPDEEYLQIFSDYAKSLGKENAQTLLEKILNRKHIATEKIESFLQELGYKEEMDGVVL